MKSRERNAQRASAAVQAAALRADAARRRRDSAARRLTALRDERTADGRWVMPLRLCGTDALPSRPARRQTLTTAAEKQRQQHFAIDTRKWLRRGST